MNGEWEGIWKEVVMAKFMVLSCHKKNKPGG
jgi:hypothetical protein